MIHSDLDFLKLDIEEQEIIDALTWSFGEIDPSCQDSNSTNDCRKTNPVEVDSSLLLQSITKIDLTTLIKSALLDPVLDEQYHHPALQDYWNERWRKSGRNPPEKAAINHMPIHENTPQSTLHTFDLLKGIFLYSNSQLCKKNGQNVLAESYLQLAASFGNYSALSELFKRYLNDTEKQLDAFNVAQLAAELYWTPGYILLALFFYRRQSYNEALLHLIIAEKLIPYSENMLKNAYRGKTIEEIIQPIFETLNARNIQEVKIKLATLARLPTYFVTHTLYIKANEKVRTIISLVKSETPSPVENPTFKISKDSIREEARPITEFRR